MTDTRTAAPNRPSSGGRAPWFVRASTRLTNRLMRLGLPTGPNVLMTIRGRTSGLPRTAPVAIVEIDGRRYILGAYGEVQWVRNLRSAGEADIRVHGRPEHVTVAELDHAAAVTFFGVILPGYVRHFPRIGRVFARILFGAVAPEILKDPERAATTRPVFELFSAAPVEVPATPAP